MVQEGSFWARTSSLLSLVFIPRERSACRYRLVISLLWLLELLRSPHPVQINFRLHFSNSYTIFQHIQRPCPQASQRGLGCASFGLSNSNSYGRPIFIPNSTFRHHLTSTTSTILPLHPPHNQSHWDVNLSGPVHFATPKPGSSHLASVVLFLGRRGGGSSRERLLFQHTHRHYLHHHHHSCIIILIISPL